MPRERPRKQPRARSPRRAPGALLDVSNALVPTITVLAIDVGLLMGGIVVVETVFSYPGLGRMLIFAIEQKDIPVVQACALIFAVTYILLNLLADVISIATNPRLLHPR